MITNYERDTHEYTPPPVIYQPIKASRIKQLIAKAKSVSVDVDASKFAGVGKSDTQKNAEFNNYTQSIADQPTQAEKDQGDKPTPNEGSVKAGGFPIPAVFKMVPIGLNILAKGPTVARGFGELLDATRQAITNTITLSMNLFTSTFDFSIQGFKMGFVLLFCMVENINNMNVCIIFYIIDLILLLVFLFISSILSILDEAIIKRMLNISLVGMLYSAYGPLTEFNDFVHSKTGIHLIHYPDSIIKKCYTCSLTPDTPGFKRSGSRFFNVVTSEAPRKIGQPLGTYSRGFGNIFSIFNL
jgi:hypothetical protein